MSRISTPAMLKRASRTTLPKMFPVPTLASLACTWILWARYLLRGEGMGVKVALIPSLTLQSLSRELAHRTLKSQYVDGRFWPLKGSQRILGMTDASYRNNSDKTSQR